MSFNFQFGGHATTPEGEAEIVRAAHKLWETIKEHSPGRETWNKAHTQHFGVGHVEALAHPDDPDKNVTVDENGDRHLEVPVEQPDVPAKEVETTAHPGGFADPQSTGNVPPPTPSPA